MRDRRLRLTGRAWRVQRSEVEGGNEEVPYGSQADSRTDDPHSDSGSRIRPRRRWGRIPRRRRWIPRRRHGRISGVSRWRRDQLPWRTGGFHAGVGTGFQSRGFHGGAFHGREFHGGAFRGGHDRFDRFNHFHRFGFFGGFGFTGSAFGFGVYPFFWDPFWFPSPYPVYSYAPPLVIQPDTQLSVQQPSSTAAPTYWYYCVDAKAYYPYTRQCPGGWLRVVPTAPAG
jgi:hypothetical protein